MLSNFPKYNEEMRLFEKSPLFKEKYQALVTYLWGFTKARPVVSGKIEAELGLGETQVRKLVEHARRNYEPIASGGKGYWMCGDYDKLMENMKHLKERAESMYYTYSRMSQGCRSRSESQTNLALTGGS